MSCPNLNTKSSTQFADLMTDMIGMIEKNPQSSMISISKKDLNKTKKALEAYKKDYKKCMDEAGGDYKCMEEVNKKLSRSIPMFGNSIYPWKNYDWNYGNHVENNYAPKYTGAKPEPTIAQAHKNANAFIKIIDGIISDPIPNVHSKAGEYNRNSDAPPLDTCNGNYRCKTTQAIKRSYQQKKPTNDKFLNKKIDGEKSSSFFFKIGTCPRKDIKSLKKCESKGYTWTPNIIAKAMGNSNSGTCNQPRYAYIDNSPKAFFNGSKMKGLLPSVVNDLASLTPDKLLGSFMGMSSGDSMTIQPCSKVIEKFGIMNQRQTTIIEFYIKIILLLIIIIIFVKHII